MDMDVTALYAPSMAQIGLSVGVRAAGLLSIGRTLRCSKALHSHKSKYNFCDLPSVIKKACIAYYLFIQALPSVYKGTHASKRDNSAIFYVILNRRTSSTP